MKMLHIQEFIRENPDWAEKLAAEPYFLKIKWKDDLVMLNYTQGISQPCEIVNEARGLILDAASDFRVVRYGFYRFYNASEPGAATLTGKLSISEKIDGSLVMFYYYKNEWHMSTRSTFDARDAVVGEFGFSFESIIKEAMNEVGMTFDELNRNYTYVFELVSPQSRVIIYYPNTRLYFLMARDNNTLEEVEIEHISNCPTPRTFSFSNLNEITNFVSQFDGFEFEGVVVKDENNNRLKVKNLNWLKLHKLHNNGRITDELILEMIMSGEDAEYLSYFPENTERFKKLKDFYCYTLTEAAQLDKKEFAKIYPIKKDFALRVQKFCSGSYVAEMFKAYDGRAEEWVKSMTAAQFVKNFCRGHSTMRKDLFDINF